MPVRLKQKKKKKKASYSLCCFLGKKSVREGLADSRGGVKQHAWHAGTSPAICMFQAVIPRLLFTKPAGARQTRTLQSPLHSRVSEQQASARLGHCPDSSWNACNTHQLYIQVWLCSPLVPLPHIICTCTETHIHTSAHRYIWTHNTHHTRTCLKSYAAVLPSTWRAGRRVGDSGLLVSFTGR